MNPLRPTELANTVTAFATVLSGLTALALCLWVGRQPRRWLAVYAGVFITGLPTVWFHGFGETYWAGVADGGTNLLLAWLMQVAALHDFYRPTIRRWVIATSAVVNLGATALKLAVGPAFSQFFPLSFGSFGGFNVNEIVLITDSLLATGLLFGGLPQTPRPARPLLYLATGVFILGTLLASASNHQVSWQIMAFHAAWHVVGAFGFIILWAYNHVRFNLA